MTKEDLNKKYNDITNLSEQYRGRIIERVIQIELAISEILVSLFANPTTRETIEKYLIDSLNLETKLNLFCSLNKKGEFGLDMKSSKINSNLKYLQGLRNYLAHAITDTSPEFINQYEYKYIRYRSYSDKGELEIYIHNDNQEENPEKRVYNSNETVRKINETQELLINLQRFEGSD